LRAVALFFILGNCYEKALSLGSIVFVSPENEAPVKLDLNAILPTETQNIDTAALGKAQQNLQLTFHKKMEDPELKVVDVVLNSFSYLGCMTHEEFYGDTPKVKPTTGSPLRMVPTNDVLPKE